MGPEGMSDFFKTFCITLVMTFLLTMPIYTFVEKPGIDARAAWKNVYEAPQEHKEIKEIKEDIENDIKNSK